jgi:hypothetical protein
VFQSSPEARRRRHTVVMPLRQPRLVLACAGAAEAERDGVEEDLGEQERFRTRPQLWCS